MLARSMGDLVDAPNRKLKLPDYQFLCTGDELIKRALDATPVVPGVPKYDDLKWLYTVAWDNSDHIAEQCEVEIPRLKSVAFPGLPEGKDAAALLYDWVAEGFLKLKPKFFGHTGGVDPITDQAIEQQYWERAWREYEMLKRKGFCDYMLAIIDVVNWMKTSDGLVMLRGSAGGCLLLWLTGASCVDPIRHDLSFERFWDDNRPDPPDVDIDFEQARRNEAIQYVYNKYGAECCAQIAALSALKAKAALVDAAAALGIQRAVYAPLAAALDSGDSDVDKQLEAITDRAALKVLEDNPELRTLIPLMIGQYRQASIHAAGVLISSEPLDHVIGVMLGQDKQQVAQLDKYGIASLGGMKMDFLSVSALDALALAARRIWGSVAPLYDLPLEDPRALEMANRGYLAGVFQLDGASAARVARTIGIHSFEDIVAASALCRPGPADWVQTYKQNKENPDQFAAYLANFNPVAAGIVAKTYGIMVFQEQVMRFAERLAGFSWPDVHKLRKGVTDKTGLDPQKGPAWRQEWSTKFVLGCRQQWVSDQEAMFWWESISTHGGYSFNRAHCVTYGFVGAWMLYLKAHHPSAFYAAYLELEADEVKQGRLAREFLSLHPENKVKLLDTEHPTASFKAVGERAIAGGLVQLRGVGPKGALKILEQFPDGTDEKSLYAALPRATSALLQQAKDDQQWHLLPLIDLAPWFPVPQLEPRHAASRQKLCADWTISKIARELNGITYAGLRLGGYVKACDFDRDRVGFLVEDETGACMVRLANRNINALGSLFKQIQPGDFVIFEGFWSGDTLFADNFVPSPEGLANDREQRRSDLPTATDFKAKPTSTRSRAKAVSRETDRERGGTGTLPNLGELAERAAVLSRSSASAGDGQQPGPSPKRERARRPTGDSASKLPPLPPIVEGGGNRGSAPLGEQVVDSGDGSALGSGASPLGPLGTERPGRGKRLE
jgi:hypothetical protein